MKLDTESPIVLERIRGEPPLKVEGASQELQKDVVNRFRWFWVFWKGINLISRYFDFSGLFHVSIVDLLVWLASSEVDFPISDDFRLYTILKMRGRRVF